jgi:D-threo-aldose 1-dehydrogenase
MPAPSLAKIPLGRTGLHVSPICFGTSGLGDMPDTYGYSVGVERALATVRAIFDGPVNFLDSSRIYGMGRSEERIGAVIRERGGLPPGFVISTKLDRDPDTGVFDAARARRSLELSLQALGLDGIQMLHLHDPEHAPDFARATARDGALGELFRMREEGLVTAVGLAAGKSEMMIPLIRDWDFDAIITHNRFTIVNRNADEMMDLCAAKGVAVLNAAPYAGGVLAKGTAEFPRYVYQQAGAEALSPVKRVEEICARHGTPPGAVALQFSMRDKRVASTVCGVSKPERVAETLAWAEFPVPDALWRDLEALEPSRDDPEAARVYSPG